MHEPSQNVQKYTHKLFIDFRIAYFCCFSLDFLDLQFNNIDSSFSLTTWLLLVHEYLFAV